MNRENRYVDNTVIEIFNDTVSKTFLFLKNKIFFDSWKSTFLRFLRIHLPRIFLPRQILKNIVMPRENPRHLTTAEINFER